MEQLVYFRMSFWQHHFVVEILWSTFYVFWQISSFRKERVIVVVESRNYFYRFWIVELIVVVWTWLPVVAVVVTPETSVIVERESSLIAPKILFQIFSRLLRYHACPLELINSIFVVSYRINRSGTFYVEISLRKQSLQNNNNMR